MFICSSSSSLFGVHARSFPGVPSACVQRDACLVWLQCVCVCAPREGSARLLIIVKNNNNSEMGEEYGPKGAKQREGEPTRQFRLPKLNFSRDNCTHDKERSSGAGCLLRLRLAGLMALEVPGAVLSRVALKVSVKSSLSSNVTPQIRHTTVLTTPGIAGAHTRDAFFSSCQLDQTLPWPCWRCSRGRLVGDVVTRESTANISTWFSLPGVLSLPSWSR